MNVRGWCLSMGLAVAAVHGGGGAALAQGTDDFVAESGARVTRTGGAIRLTAGPGWLRLPRVVSNVEVEFEYRSAAPDMEASFGFRSWPAYEAIGSPGYFVRLSELDALQTAGKITSVVAQSKPAALPVAGPRSGPARTDGWHLVHLRVENTAVTVSIDGRPTDAADALDEFAGYLTLTCARGAVDVRGVTVRPILPPADAFVGAHPMSERGLTRPRLLREAKPFYPMEPLKAAVQGVVVIDIVIGADGTPVAARVVKPLHPDLDEAAMAAARKWRFSPGAQAAVAVPVIATIELSFTIGESSGR